MDTVYVDDATLGWQLQSSFGLQLSPSAHVARIAVVGQDPSAVAALRASYPELGIICVVQDTRTDTVASQLVLDLLRAGADRCLVRPRASEVAAQVVAVARRLDNRNA